MRLLVEEAAVWAQGLGPCNQNSFTYLFYNQLRGKLNRLNEKHFNDFTQPLLPTDRETGLRPKEPERRPITRHRPHAEQASSPQGHTLNTASPVLPAAEMGAPRRPGDGLGPAPIPRNTSTTLRSVSTGNTQAPEPQRKNIRDFPYPQQDQIPFSALRDILGP